MPNGETVIQRDTDTVVDRFGNIVIQRGMATEMDAPAFTGTVIANMALSLSI